MVIAEYTHDRSWHISTIHIDLGKDEPGMVLQRRYREGGTYVWNDYLMDGEAVVPPVDLEALPPGKYRLVTV